MLAVNHEHRQIVVAGEIRAGRLHDVEVGEPSRRRPRRLLPDLEPAVHAFGAGGDRVPEVRAGLGVGIGQRADRLAGRQRPDVLVDQLRRGAQHDRVHRAHVHHVAHGGRRAAVTGDRLAHHRVGDVVLAQAAVLLGDGERQEPVLSQDLQVLPGEHQLVVEALRVSPELLLAELDERRSELLLVVRVHPLGVPFVPEAPEGLRPPHLLGHPHLHERGRPLVSHRRFAAAASGNAAGPVTFSNRKGAACRPFPTSSAAPRPGSPPHGAASSAPRSA